MAVLQVGQLNVCPNKQSVAQVNNFTFHYAFYVVMNWLPTYFDSVLHASLSSTGSVKMLPYLVMFAMSNAGGYAGEWLIARHSSVARARKMVNSAGARNRLHNDRHNSVNKTRCSFTKIYGASIRIYGALSVACAQKMVNSAGERLSKDSFQKTC